MTIGAFLGDSEPITAAAQKVNVVHELLALADVTNDMDTLSTAGAGAGAGAGEGEGEAEKEKEKEKKKEETGDWVAAAEKEEDEAGRAPVTAEEEGGGQVPR